PSPPEPPQTRTTSFGFTVCSGQAMSMRYAVAPTSMYAAAASHVRCFGFGRHWWACTLVNCAKLPQLVSYPQIWKLGANLGSCPAFTYGSLRSQTPQWITTSSPTLWVVTSLPTAYTTPDASL